MSWTSRQLLNRRFQAGMNSEDGFLTGYFLLWLEVPTAVANVFTSLFAPDKYNLVDSNSDDMTRMLSALATGVPSIPDTTVNQTSLNGIGGTKWGVTTNIETPSTFSVKFRELAGLPVCKTMASWFTLIRDPNSGASLLTGSNYTKKNFYGRATLAHLKPDMQTVEMGTRFEGIFPTKYPTDLFNSDNATVEALEPEIEFHCDSVWSDNEALKQAQVIVDGLGQMLPFHEAGTPSLYSAS